MNFKKFISGVSALTIAASAFAAMAVTANAAYSFTDNVYTWKPDSSEFTVKNGDSDEYNGLKVTIAGSNDWRFYNGGAQYYVVHWQSKSASANRNIQFTPTENGKLTINGDSTYAVSKTAAATDIGKNADGSYSLKAGTLYYIVPNDACNIYSITYDVNPDPVNSITVNYVADGNVVYSDTSISTDGKYAGNQYKIPYRRYVSKDGVLYQSSKTSNEYGKTVTAAVDTVVEIPVTAVNIAEGETFIAVVDGDGDSGNNAGIRASYGSAANGTLEIADVQPGIYKLVYCQYKRGDGNPQLALDDDIIRDITNGSGWTEDVTEENIVVSKAGTLKFVDCRMTDTVVLYKTDDLPSAQPDKKGFSFTQTVEEVADKTLYVTATINGKDKMAEIGNVGALIDTVMTDATAQLTVFLSNIPADYENVGVVID